MKTTELAKNRACFCHILLVWEWLGVFTQEDHFSECGGRVENTSMLALVSAALCVIGIYNWCCWESPPFGVILGQQHIYSAHSVCRDLSWTTWTVKRLCCNIRWCLVFVPLPKSEYKQAIISNMLDLDGTDFASCFDKWMLGGAVDQTYSRYI